MEERRKGVDVQNAAYAGELHARSTKLSKRIHKHFTAETS